MGLDLAELLMDCEDHFGIVFDEDEKIASTVQELEDYILKYRDEDKIIKVDRLKEIIGNRSDIDKGLYKECRGAFRKLPRIPLFGGVPTEFANPAGIYTYFEQWRSSIIGLSDEEVRLKIKELIGEVISVDPDEIRSEHNLIKDLGMD